MAFQRSPLSGAEPASTASIVCVGEILWDVLPSGRYLGGAPFNVAGHLARLGCTPQLISRVGSDAAGAAAVRAVLDLGIGGSLLQRDDRHPTGEAQVSVDEFGSPTYTFLSPAAWDFIEPNAAAIRAVSTADATIFGTLAQRTASSHRAIIEIIHAARFRVFDPNLRRPHINREVTLQSLLRADLIKVSEEECTAVGGWLGIADDPAALLAALSRTRSGFGRPPLELCITRGSRGAVYFAEGQWHNQPAVPTEVADAVGAGDAFLAMLVAQRLKGVPPAVALRRATALAAFVVSRPGAVPEYDARVFLTD